MILLPLFNRAQRLEHLERSTKEIREQLIDLIGEGAWQYAYYNFELKDLILGASDLHQLAEVIQDLIAADLQSNGHDYSLPEFE